MAKVKRLMDGEWIELAEGDSVIRVALFDLYEGSKLICRCDKNYDQLRANVEKNLDIQFNKLSVEERARIVKERADKGGGLMTVVIKPMLKSKFDKKRSYTKGSLLFCTPKKEDERE